jgi:hypothetical protein
MSPQECDALRLTVESWRSRLQGNDSGLVTMLLIGGAVFPLTHAAIAWHWRFSVRDELEAQKVSGENQAG